MVKKLRVDDVDYDLDHLGARGAATVASLQFATKRLEELSNMRALLTRAKQGYIDSLRKEVVSEKAGLLLNDD